MKLIKTFNGKNLELLSVYSINIKQKLLNCVYKILFASLIIGMCFSILYPLLKTLPMVFCDLEDLGNPDVIWIPIKRSVLSFKAAIRFIYKDVRIIFQSLGYATIITVIQTFISAMTGYALARVKFRGSNFIFFVVIVTFIVPPQSLLISQYLYFKNFDIFGIIRLIRGTTLDLINKPYTLYIIAFLGFGVKQSLFVFIFRQFFKGLPTELEEAALIDGCGFHKTYYRIAIPNAIPAMVVVSTLAFVWNYGDTYYTSYFHPDGPYLSLMLTNTFSSANVNNVLRALNVWYGVAGTTTFAFDAVKQAATILYMLPLLIVYFIVQKKLVENFERSGIVG
ncbi:MAG TPA: carbohydrate ABC transporter permease [Tissierellaceae bacterium]